MAHSNKRRTRNSENGYRPYYHLPGDARPSEQNESTVTNLIRQYSLSRIGHAELYSPSGLGENCDRGDYIAGAALGEAEKSNFMLRRA